MSDAYMGEIRLFAGDYAPENWALCDGALLPISQYNALFALLGTTYGGDGQATFGLPDLRGRLPLGKGGTYAMTQQLGVETVTLTADQWPPHTHTVQAVTTTADTDSPAGAVTAVPTVNLYAPSATNVGLKSTSVDSFGGGGAHDNIMPFLVVNYIICTSGLYPTQQ